MIEIVEGRKCGGCTLCCRLLPVREGVKKDGVELFRTFDKPAGQRCQHQRSTGCAIYAQRPVSCRLWHCMWLMGTPELDHRPDRVGFCVDMQPDFVTVHDPVADKEVKIPVVQIWVDPARPDAHRDPGLRRFLDRLGREKGMAAIIRYSPMDGFVLFPPALCRDGQWHEKDSNVKREYEHSPEEIVEAFAAMESQQ